jgi:threonyl-tRNA synthetase
MVIPIADEFNGYAKQVYNKVNEVGVNCEMDLKNHNLNYKIREHSMSKVPLLLICGKKEVDSNAITIRRLDSQKQETMELNTFLKKFSALNKAPSF